MLSLFHFILGFKEKSTRYSKQLNKCPGIEVKIKLIDMFDNLKLHYYFLKERKVKNTTKLKLKHYN